jgi:hypothetical protein
MKVHRDIKLQDHGNPRLQEWENTCAFWFDMVGAYLKRPERGIWDYLKWFRELLAEWRVRGNDSIADWQTIGYIIPLARILVAEGYEREGEARGAVMKLYVGWFPGGLCQLAHRRDGTTLV